MIYDVNSLLVRYGAHGYRSVSLVWHLLYNNINYSKTAVQMTKKEKVGPTRLSSCAVVLKWGSTVGGEAAVGNEVMVKIGYKNDKDRAMAEVRRCL